MAPPDRSASFDDPTFDDVLAHRYWRHRIPLGDGRVTPGVKAAGHWDAIGLPSNLDDRTVLDVGTFDGLHAFEAERRGAARVLATDVWGRAPDSSGAYPSRAGFELARTYRDSDVEGRRVDVHDLSSNVDNFELVICTGVIEFVADPALALDVLGRVATDRIVVDAPIATDRDPGPIDPRVIESEKLAMSGSPQSDVSVGWLVDRLQRGGCRVDRVAIPDYSSHDAFPCPSARVVGNQPVFATHDGDRRIETLESGTAVTVLFEADRMQRIEFAAGDTARQGWVESTSVASSDDSLARRVSGVYQRRGATGLARLAVPDRLAAAGRRWLGGGGTDAPGSRAVVHVDVA